MTEQKTIPTGFNRDEELRRRAVLAQETDHNAKVAKEEARRLRKEMKRARKAYKRAKQSAKRTDKEARQAQADLQACLDHAIRDLAQILQKAASAGKPEAGNLEPRPANANFEPAALPDEIGKDTRPTAASA
jgi:hypothetical protein